MKRFGTFIKKHIALIIWAMCSLAFLFVWEAAGFIFAAVTYPIADQLENKFNNDKND